MLKIPKGLKKKKKDKKHKRKEEDELFNEEELEKYRKEHQHQSAGADSAEQSAENASSSTTTDKSDEWEKFKALTAGVDTILQKTQEDLDRIKSTSFFQRKAPAPPPPPPPSETEKKEGEGTDTTEAEKSKKKKSRKVETEKRESKTLKEENASEVQEQQDHTEYEEDNEEDEEEEEEPEEDEFVDDSIFETSYVDAVASGELKLAYIPDSPEKEDDFDPFDTSIADKFIESNPKKRYLNLGCAVEVLSGKVNPNTAVTVDKRTSKRRGRPADLLLSSFDEGADPPPQTTLEAINTYDSPVKTLLDDDPTFIDTDTTLLPPAPSPEVAPLPVSTVTNTENVSNATKLDLSEFEINLATSIVAPLTEQPSVESVDDEFEQLAAESLAKKTSISTEVQRPTSIDLLSQGIADLSDGIHALPINPNAVQSHTPDPFDTSVADKVLVPGKSEIKLLEKELLDRPVPQLSQLEDDDFDPRAEETTVTPVSQPIPQNLPSPVLTDYLTESHEEETVVAKPLTPAANTPEAEDFDPFDTSHVSGAPGKLELKLIEKELAAADVEDEKFDPRNFDKSTNSTNPTITDIILNKYNVLQAENEKPEEPAYIDILTGDEKTREIESEEVPPPVEPQRFSELDEIEDTYIDPFDTSIADHIVPGRTELKILENELIN